MLAIRVINHAFLVEDSAHNSELLDIESTGAASVGDSTMSEMWWVEVLLIGEESDTACKPKFGPTLNMTSNLSYAMQDNCTVLAPAGCVAVEGFLKMKRLLVIKLGIWWRQLHCNSIVSAEWTPFRVGQG